MITAPAVLRQLAKYFRRHSPPIEPEEIDGSAFLAKASIDCWDYIVGTKAGVIIRCAELTHRRGWLYLNGIESVLLANGKELHKGSFYYSRGMELRLTEVAFVCDCDS